MKKGGGMIGGHRREVERYGEDIKGIKHKGQIQSSRVECNRSRVEYSSEQYSTAHTAQ